MPDATCSVDDCNKPVVARGWCRLHYARWWRTGELNTRRSRPTCSMDGCGRPHAARGWCTMHLKRWVRHGDPTYVTRVIGDDERRFWSKVNKDGPGGCWLWTGLLDQAGYGQLKINGRQVKAHRFVYELLVGAIPEGLHIDHVHARGCRHRNCVNPAHLEPVTPSENSRRANLVRWDA